MVPHAPKLRNGVAAASAAVPVCKLSRHSGRRL